MIQELEPGDLVYITKNYEDYFNKRHPVSLMRSFAHRLAKLESIIDWESSDGKKIKKAREMSGKWKGLPIEENKYILSIYFPELPGRKGQQGVIERGVPMFRYNPEDGQPFFVKVPEWFYAEVIKKCEIFSIK